MVADIVAVTSPCPGCGLVLPGASGDADPRSTASEACRATYGEVLGYEYGHMAKVGRWHQLLVDTYAAQHAGDRSPAIATAFALIGLCLTLDHGWSGIDVRDIHQQLASRYRDWPSFSRPPGQVDTTIQDLALAGSPADYAAILQRWAGAVWAWWREEHRRVEALLGERLGRPINYEA
jgi:hypothetical protein